MIKRKRLGQHFLNSPSIAEFIVSSAEISSTGTVLEIGIGEGVLTRLLIPVSKKLICIESDSDLVDEARENFSFADNLELIHGDGFKEKRDFEIFVSNLPYSRSRDAIEWLSEQEFSHGVIMVQKEFFEKLMESEGKERRAVSVIANYCMEINQIKKVGKENFTPPPKVDSVILKIKKIKNLDLQTIQTINKIFSFRRKTVKNILNQFGKNSDDSRRIDDLKGEEIVGLAKQIIQK